MSLEKEHKLRGQIMQDLELSDEALDKLVTKEIDDKGGYINPFAALVLIAERKGMKRENMQVFSPEEKARAKILGKINAEQLDGMIDILQKQSVYFKTNVLLAYEFIAKKLDIVLVEDLQEAAREQPVTTIKQWLAGADQTIGNAEGMVVNQKVQRKKGGDWSTLYVTTIIDADGDTLDIKTWNKDKAFSPYFLRHGNWYTFFGVKKEIGKEREDGSFWANTYWWYGESEKSKKQARPKATSLINALDPYKTYVLEGVISNFRSGKGYTAYNPYTDKYITNRATVDPEPEQIGEQPGFKEMLYHNKYLFTLNTIDGRLDCVTQGFPFYVVARSVYRNQLTGFEEDGEKRKDKLPADTLDDYKVRIFGNILDGSEGRDRLGMVRGIIKIELSQDTGLGEVDSLLDKLIAQGFVNLDVPSQPQEEVKTRLVNYDDLQIDPLIDWYMKEQIGDPITIQEFKDNLWKGFGIAVDEETNMKIIKVLIAEGLIHEIKDGKVYPNG